MKDYINFAIKEYDSLRIEARDAVNESRTVERQSILASGAVWAWLLTQPHASLYAEYAKWIPLAISLLGALRSIALHIRLIRISEYLRSQELRYGRTHYFQWETYLSEKSWVLTGTSAIFWVAITAANALASELL